MKKFNLSKNGQSGAGRNEKRGARSLFLLLALTLLLLLTVAGCSGKGKKISAVEPSPAVKIAADNYFKMTEEESETTRYYSYDVDLNGDGIDEVLLVMVGRYTSGSGGDSMLILEPCGTIKDGAENAVAGSRSLGNTDKNQYRVQQDFTLIRLPLVIAEASYVKSDNNEVDNNKTDNNKSYKNKADKNKAAAKEYNAYKDIYLRAGGGGAPYRIVKLSADAKGIYCSVNDAEEISEEQMKKVKIKYYLTEE